MRYGLPGYRNEIYIKRRKLTKNGKLTTNCIYGWMYIQSMFGTIDSVATMELTIWVWFWLILFWWCFKDCGGENGSRHHQQFNSMEGPGRDRGEQSRATQLLGKALETMGVRPDVGPRIILCDIYPALGVGWFSNKMFDVWTRMDCQPICPEPSKYYQ